MRICKFWELLEPNYQVIFQGWMDAQSTKSVQRNDFPNVLIQILNVTLYNLRSITFPVLFFSTLSLNIKDFRFQISILNKPVPRTLNVLEKC